ncbi:MAG TPA: NfeD family protein [Pirellulales bacterium]
MSPVVWALLALVLGLVIAGLEIFVPSGGILAFLAFSCLVTALFLAFSYSAPLGLGFTIVILIGLPMILAAALRILPYTPIGRRVMLAAPDADEVLPDDQTWGGLQALLGQTGRAKTPMLPSGAVNINGRVVDAISRGVPIDAGSFVRVVEVRGHRVVVEAIDEAAILPKSNDPLAQPVDLDPFQLPPT